MKLRIVSWNVAGCHTMASMDHFDYLPEDIEYFADHLQKIEPDIICLQESHTSIDGSSGNAEKLARRIGFPYLFNSSCSVSHVDKDYKLGNSIISKIKFNDEHIAFFPNPEGDLFWSDGRLALTHEKGVQVVSFDLFNVANSQMLPARLFGFNYDDGGRGSKLAEGINEVMKKEVEKPVIWCGDFNFSDPLKVYSHLINLGMKDALPEVNTLPSKDVTKKKSDFIFYSPEFKLIDSGVIETNTDHYLCWAEFDK